MKKTFEIFIISKVFFFFHTFTYKSMKHFRTNNISYTIAASFFNISIKITDTLFLNYYNETKNLKT